jgi:hypothetical protein
MGLYARIYNNEVISTRETNDQILIDKLLAKGWWLPIEDTTQQYDPKTQYLSNTISYEIQETKVLQWKEVINYTQLQLDGINESNRQNVLLRINQDVTTYILQHYDSGTQQSFTGIYAKRDTPDLVRDYLDPVWSWISAVLGYYYQQKSLIIDAQDPTTVIWNFTQFDATDPQVSLQNLILA